MVYLIEPNNVLYLFLLKGRDQLDNVPPLLAFPHFCSQLFSFLPHSGCLGFAPLNELFTVRFASALFFNLEEDMATHSTILFLYYFLLFGTQRDSTQLCET